MGGIGLGGVCNSHSRVHNVAVLLWHFYILGNLGLYIHGYFGHYWGFFWGRGSYNCSWNMGWEVDFVIVLVIRCREVRIACLPFLMTGTKYHPP